MKFIFEVTMKPGFSLEEYAQGWLRASEIIQQAPGAQGTYLHRKIGSTDKALAIAHWDSKKARDAKDDTRDATVRAILEKHAKHCDIRVIGEYEEAEWEVTPRKDS